jgi:hypothetical protein
MTLPPDNVSSIEEMQVYLLIVSELYSLLVMCPLLLV